ncbi:MAG: S41 family peptidase [Mangrovibacterium sp.]
MKLANKVKIGIGASVLAFLVVLITSASRDEKMFAIDKNLDIFHAIIRELNVFYVDELDADKMMRTGIDEMLKTLDPYTTFIPEKEIDDFNFMTTGEYAGVGAIIALKGEDIIVSEPYQGFPADKAGLRAGDIFVEVAGKSVKGMDVEGVSNLLKGTSNEMLTVKVKRFGEKKTLSFDVVRKQIQIDAVPYYGMLDNKVGYLQLSSFTEGCGNEIRKIVKELKEKDGATSLILDLRNNPGGLLNEAVTIVSAFVPKGTKVVFTKSKVEKWDQEYFTTENPIDENIPLAVLVNKRSASASEIVSGALQDLDRAVVIGSRTFGKGLVQATRDLSYNSKLKLTTAKYYVPSGRCIQALDYSNRNEDGSVGVVPDSLITEFSTNNGRKVYDGGGITPDIKVELPTGSSFIYYLMRDYMIFDYATKYFYEHESIAAANQFEINDEIYADFLKFIKEKDFSYESETEKALDELEKTAKLEKYYDRSKTEFEALRQQVKHELDKDVEDFKEEIKILLLDEIVTRYHYQKGAIIASLKSDIVLHRAESIVCSADSLSAYFKPGTIIAKEK